ncbi:hypothetical protein [Saccharothrix sp. HUAS TT1]
MSLDQTGRRVVVMPPAPAGSYDWAELDALIAALRDVRQLLPGTSR